MLTPKSSIHRNKNAPAAKIPLQPQHLYLIPCFYRSASCRYLDQAVTAYHTAHLPLALVWKPYSFPSAFPLKKRRLLLFFEKPVTAVRVSRRSFRSGSPIFNDRISRTNIQGIAAENGLPESPINKTPSFSAARVGIPGLMAIP